MQKITLTIEGREYDITIEEKFAWYLQKELQKDFSANISVKELLQAYLRKCYECYQNQKKLDRLLERLQIQ